MEAKEYPRFFKKPDIKKEAFGFVKTLLSRRNRIIINVKELVAKRVNVTRTEVVQRLLRSTAVDGNMPNSVHT